MLITSVRPTAYGVAGAPTLVLEAEHVAMDQGNAMCDQAIDDLPDGVHAEARVVAGPAGRAIAEAARDDVDLLVAGSRAYGAMKSVLLGSTSGYLADHAACPVLVVPQGSAATIGGTTTATAAAEA